HEVYLPDQVLRRLGKIAQPDRGRITELVRSGTCACEPCQLLRKKHGLPIAPEPATANPKGRKPEAAGKATITSPSPKYDLRTAPIYRYRDVALLRKNPAEAVVLDLSQSRRNPMPAGFLASLPRYPIHALNLREVPMRALPVAV